MGNELLEFNRKVEEFESIVFTYESAKKLKLDKEDERNFLYSSIKRHLKTGELYSMFRNLRNISETHDFYFSGCSFRVYKNTYDDRYAEYIDCDPSPDKTEISFIKEEIFVIKSWIKGDLKLHLYTAVELSIDRILKFLKQRKKSLNKKMKEKPMKQAELTNYQLIYLFKELGILNHLMDTKGYDKKQVSYILSLISVKGQKRLQAAMSDHVIKENKPTASHKKQLDKIQDFIKNL